MKKITLKNAAAVLAAVYIACTALTACGRVEIPKNEVPVPSATTASSENVTDKTETVTTPPAVTAVTSSSAAAKTDAKKNSKKKKSKSTKKTTTAAAATTAVTTTKATTAAVVSTYIPQTTVTTTTPTETTTEPQTTTTTEQDLPEQIIPVITSTAAPVTVPTETQDSDITEFDSNDFVQNGRNHLIDLKCIMQIPELPMGCEAVSLAMVFNYYNIYADKMAMANYYMPREDVYTLNGTMYGPDFRYTFAGDPADPKAYGCLAPCMMITAQNYINDVGGGVYPFDASGSSFEDLLTNYIDNDIPLLLWVTSGLEAPYYSRTWITPTGEQMYWLTPEHCLVLTGYDLDANIVYVADPMVGNVAYNYDLVKQRYYELGQQSMGLMPC